MEKALRGLWRTWTPDLFTFPRFPTECPRKDSCHAGKEFPLRSDVNALGRPVLNLPRDDTHQPVAELGTELLTRSFLMCWWPYEKEQDMEAGTPALTVGQVHSTSSPPQNCEMTGIKGRSGMS